MTTESTDHQLLYMFLDTLAARLRSERAFLTVELDKLDAGLKRENWTQVETNDLVILAGLKNIEEEIADYAEMIRKVIEWGVE